MGGRLGLAVQAAAFRVVDFFAIGNTLAGFRYSLAYPLSRKRERGNYWAPLSHLWEGPGEEGRRPKHFGNAW